MAYHYVYCSYDSEYNLYIGVRKSKKEPDKDKYLGSFRNKSFKPIGKWILGCFFNRGDAISYEIYLHELWNVKANELFINKSHQTSSGFDTAGMPNPRRGAKASEKTRALISQSMIGRPAWNKGIPCSSEAKRKCSEAQSGRKMSTEKKAIFMSNPNINFQFNLGHKYIWHHVEYGYFELYQCELTSQFCISTPSAIKIKQNPEKNCKGWSCVGCII